MNVFIPKSHARGTANAPPSKSYAHRMMICAALADGESVLSGIEESEDVLATLDCLRALGATVKKDGASLTVLGVGASRPSHPVFPCRESGSTLRFLLPIALLYAQEVTFCGSARLMERGISVYEETLSQKGITFTKNSTSITARGRLTAGEYLLPGDVSSQFLSGLAFALPLLDGDSTLRILPPFESRAYFDLTLDALGRFGISVEKEDAFTYRIRGNQSYLAHAEAVEGDWSNAAFLFALSTLGDAVTVAGLNPNSLQGDRVCLSHLARLQNGCPSLDLSECPDLAPILFAVAAECHGAHFSGTARLKIKESDRATVMARELAKFGAKVTVNENSVEIEKAPLHAPAEVLCGHNDHRIVMALSVLASRYGAVITDAQAVAKSYPDFFETLQALGVEVKYEP